MLTCMPTRLRATTESHPAHATPCLESALHSLELPCSHPMHTASATFDEPSLVTVLRFRAQVATATPRKQHSIPIHPPR